MNTNIIESITIEQMEGALNTWAAKPTRLLSTFVKGVDMALGKREFDAAVLLELGDAIECGTSEVVNIASLISLALIAAYESAGALIERLTKSKKVQGRLGALYCLHPALPVECLKTVIATLISDKSKKVREMAIDWVGRHKKVQLLPLLRVALEHESDIAMSAYIAKEIALLSDGYHVSRENGSVFVTVAEFDGRYGGFFNEPNSDKLGDDEIAAQFLKKSDR